MTTTDRELRRLLKLDEPRKPRVLRNIRCDEISSVDHGAAIGARVVLTKRGMGSREEEERRRDPLVAINGKPRRSRKMSSSSRCPTCNQKLPDGFDDDLDDTEKRHSLDDISKGARLSVDSLVGDFRAAMGPAASETDVAKRAADSSLMNEIHKQERDARMRALGNL